MMYPKPKSAPGRILQSKLVKNRTNAMKEIEAWAKKADDAGTSNASRMSGQLTDNVTEERMLRAKLWELSKERYKFLTQNAYEKKVFTDRMQRKSSALLRRTSSAGGGAAANDSEGRGMSRAKRRWRNARLALIDRLDPTRNRDDFSRELEDRSEPAKYKDDPNKATEDRLEAGKANENEDSKREESKRKGLASGGRNRMTPAATPISIRPATCAGGRLNLAPLPTAPSPSVATEEGLRGKPPLSPMLSSNPRNVKFDNPSPTEAAVWRQASAGAGSRSSPRPSPGRLPSPRVQQTKAVPDSAASSKPNSATSQRSSPWTNPTFAQIASTSFEKKRGVLAGRYGLRLESKTKDPRYSSLENSLSPVHKQRSSTDITSIVRSFDSLHVPPRRRNESKPKVELKALEYMEEQGFIF